MTNSFIFQLLRNGHQFLSQALVGVLQHFCQQKRFLGVQLPEIVCLSGDLNFFPQRKQATTVRQIGVAELGPLAVIP